MIHKMWGYTKKKCAGNSIRLTVLTVVAIMLMLFSVENPSAEVMINEFMADNVNASPDMCDFDDFSDWIELYNNSDTTVDLKGYFLTDKLDNPTKWPIPDGATIEPKGFLVIRADGSDAAPGTEATREYHPYDLKFTTKRYHTNFKLDDLGDCVGLFKRVDTDIVPVDTVTFARQLPDISMGRNTDGGTEWYKFDCPTPGYENTTEAKPLSLVTYSPSVKFSATPGFSSETQTVTIEASSGTDNTIYYTTNGTVPTTGSNKYSGPVVIDKNTVLRARCINSSTLAGTVATASYFVNETPRTMMRVSVVADSTYLWDDEIGMYQNSYKDKRIPASIEFFQPDGSFMTQVNAGINPGTLTSYTCPQKPLQVGLKGGKYGSDFIVAQIFDKKAASYEKIRIRNSGDSWGTTLLGDAVVESMCNGQLNNGASAYKPVIVYINGEYWGVMELREQFDEQYFTNNYNVDPTSLNHYSKSILPPAPGREGWELNAGSWDEYNELMSMAKSGSMNDSDRYKSVSERIDENSLMDYIAAEDYGANISWGHNVEMWKVHGTTWRWLLCDFDRAFTYSKVALNLFNNSGGGMSGSIIPKDTLFTKLISNSEFKNRFVQRFAAHLNSTFSSVRMIGIVDSLYNILKPEMPDQIARWKDAKGSIQSMDAWEGNIEKMKNFMAERPANVFNHLKSQFELSGYTTLTIEDDEQGDVYINDVKMCAGTDSLTFFKDIPLKIRAVPKPGYVFAGWKEIATDNEITLTLTENTTIKAMFEVSERHILPLTITSDTTLSLTDQPYVVTGDLEVKEGATLTIAKGVTIALAQNAGIYVQGTMNVNGTADDPVTFKADEVSGATSWAAICFDSAEDTNTMSYAIIKDCTLGRDAVNHKGGINGNQSVVHMDHLTMSNIVYPLYFEGGSTILRNSTVTINHICNGGIHIGRGGAIVENNDFVSTGVTMNTDAIDIKGVIDGIVRGNDVYNFNGPNSDGIDLGEGAKNILVEGNIVSGNRDKGISIGGKSTAIIRNNIITDCDMGIGIKDAGSSAVLDHNTFIRCNHAVECYEKAYPRGGGSLTVKNSILAYSKVGTYVNDAVSPVTFSYCLSDIDLLPGTGNIKADPQFIDQFNFNFQLQESSSAINAGDPDAEPDEDGSRTDIGAQYSYDPTDFPIGVIPRYVPSVVINEIMYKDNDAVGSKDWIELYNATDNPVDISNWRLTDRDMPDPAVPLDVPALPVTSDGDLDSSHIFFIPEETVLEPFSYYVILKSSSDFFDAYPSGVTNYCKKLLTIGFDNNERIGLYDCNNTLVTAARYGSESPYPEAANGGGSSLELVNPNNYNFISFNWAASTTPGGTPGQVNSVYSTPINKKMNNVVKRFSHIGNYPNPFRKSTTFMLNLAKDDHVSINVFSLSGKKLCTVVDTDMKRGVNRILWNNVNLASGIYIYKIKTSTLILTNKLNVR
ncbi:MAG: T9SS type A sorting domain-containing protein [Fibrobacter sp.]|nr:T9SS type A sorting domain-containing protein [Fibrobacter sp.]